MRLERLRRPGLWIPLTALAALGAWVAPRLYVADLESALVREANEIVAAPRPRPVHVDAPRAGSFADALREPLRRYERGWNTLVGTDEARALVSAIARGERPLSDLPANVASGLSRLDADLDAVLEASHAERADLGPDHDPFGPFKGTSWLGVNAAAMHAAIRIRASASTRPPSNRAVSDCVDGLALGRDAALSGGLIGRMVRAGIIGRLTSACAESISGSEIGAVRATGERLRRLRDATPSFGAVLREEAIQVQLLAYGRRLPAAAKGRLLPRPRAFADDASMELAGALGHLRSRLAWRDLRTLQSELVTIGMRPAAERDAGFAALGHSSLLLRLLIGDLDGPDTVASFARYSRIDAAAESELDLLVAVVAAREFHDLRSRWPSSVAELISDGLLSVDEGRRLSRLVLDPPLEGGAFELVLPVPAAEAGDVAEAVVRVSAGNDAAGPRRE